MAAQSNGEYQIVVSVGPEEALDELRRVLDSKHFVHAPKKRKFLQLICDFYLQGRAAELNEYLIGREVFDRDESYNPAADPIVRVGAHDIRKKLGLYYQNEGANDEVRLEIPVGSYEPVFNRRRQPSIEPRPTPESNSQAIRNSLAEAEPATEPVSGEVGVAPAMPAMPAKKDEVATKPTEHRNRWRKTAIALGVLSALLLVAAGGLAWNNANLRRQARAAAASTDHAGAVWRPFLESGSPTLLVLSNPAVYRLVNAGDPEVAVKNSVPLTPEQTAALTATLKENFAVRNISPDPRLLTSVDTYTGMGEAIGAQRVTDLLRTAGKSVALKRSRTVSAEDLKDHSVILFGSVWSNEWSGKLPLMEDFLFSGQATIENRNPRAGEQTVYRSRFDERTGRLIEDYALVTVKPNITEETAMMVLAGLRSAGTEAAAEFATSRRFLNEFNRRLAEAGSPRYYQALLKVGVENGIPTTISLDSIHELRAK